MTQKEARSAKLTEDARQYRDNHHWVPLRLNGKNPNVMGEGWEERTLKDAVPKFKEKDNIGILLGKPSGDLVRLDADFPAIPDVTDVLFPEATMTFGRASSSRSGRLVTCKIKSTNFKLPESMRGHPRLPLHDGKPGLMVFQIQSTGTQAMVPPSIHPSGEEVTWRSPSEIGPRTIDAPELLRRAGIEAFLMAVRQFWPARGTRNEAAWSLARVLLETLAAHHADDAERCAIVDALVVAVAMDGGDGEDSRTARRGPQRRSRRCEPARTRPA
jgi:Bifunctional DNA primase/polymerase, N-terminal